MKLLPEHIWVDIPNSNYQISSSGYIRNPEGKVRKCVANKNTGYIQVVLYIDLKPVTFYVHRLVAEAFIPNPDNLPEINHKDGNRSNNNFWNLEWCTHSTNMSLRTYGKPVLCYSLDNIFLKEYQSIKEAAEDVRGNANNIYQCCRGIRKTHKSLIWKYK